MKIPAYPKTKPSGVEWLGNVPEHWEVKRLKTSATCWVSNVDKVPAEDELPVRLCNYTDVYYHDHITSDMELMETTATADEIRRFGLRVGDVVITKDSEEWSDIAVPALVKKSAPDLVCGYHLAIIRSRPKVLFGDYLLRAFQSCAVNQQFQLAASGVTRYGLPKASIGDAWIPLPDPAEQKSIAAFLDRETGRIDTLVAKKRELIERLKEKRTALISRTVTRGLDPNVALKPSGLDWLGDIPKHWEVIRFRRLITRLDQGWSPNANNYPAAFDELGVLKLGAASKGRFYPEDNKSLDEVPEGVVPITPASGDLLISRANTPDLVGDACVVRGNHPNRIIPDLLYRLRLRADTNGDFVCWFLLSRLGRAQIECDARGSSGSMVKLGQGHVRAWSLPLPPLAEQSAIAAYLDVETGRLDALAGKVETAIERLQEYRTALITAAVTGKIDVRKALA
jgi:type I restriction enzyme S subunit